MFPVLDTIDHLAFLLVALPELHFPAGDLIIVLMRIDRANKFFAASRPSHFLCLDVYYSLVMMISSARLAFPLVLHLSSVCIFSLFSEYCILKTLADLSRSGTSFAGTGSEVSTAMRTGSAVSASAMME